MATSTSLQFKITSAYDGGAVDRARASITALNRDLESLSNQSVKVTVSVDSSALTRLRTDLDAIGRTHATATASVNTNMSSLTAARAELSRFAATRATANANVNTNMGALTLAQARMTVFGAMHETATADVNVDNAHLHLTNLGTDLGSSVRDMGSLVGAAGGAGQALGGVASAAGGAAGGLGSVGSAGSSAGGGMGAAAQGIAIASVAMAAFTALAPIMAASVILIPVAFIGVAGLLISKNKELHKSFKEAFQDTMQTIIPLAMPVMQALVRALQQVSAWVKLIGPAIHEAFSAAAPLVQPLLNIILKLVGGALPGFTAAMRGMKPLIDGLGQGALKMGGYLGEAANVLARIPGLGQAMSGIMGALGQVILQFAKAIAQVVAADHGQLMIQLLQATSVWIKVLIPLIQLNGYMWVGLSIIMRGVGDVMIALEVALKAFFLMFIGQGPIVAAFKVAWVASWNGIKIASMAIWNAMTIAWRATVQGLIIAWNATSAGLRAAWNAVWNGMKIFAMATWNALGVAWRAFSGAMQVAMTALRNAMVAAWNLLWNTFKVVASATWNVLRAGFIVFRNAIEVAMTVFRNAMVAAWNLLWNTFKNVANIAWNLLRAGFIVFRNAIEAAMTVFRNAMVAAWNLLWNTFKNVANAAWNALKAGWNAFSAITRTAMTALRVAMVAAWNLMYNTFKNIANAAWSALKSSFSAFSNAFQSATKALMHALADAWGAGAAAIGKAWTSIKKLVRDPIQAVVNVVYNNGIVKLWNVVAGVFGAPPLQPFTLKGFATGGPVTGPGTGTSDSIVARVSAGEHVWTAAEVEAVGGHRQVLAMRQHAIGGSYKPSPRGDGQGGFALGGVIPSPGDIANAIGGAIGKLIKDVKGVAGAAFNLATGFGGDILGELGKLAMGEIAGPMNSLVQKAANVGKDTVKGIIPGSPWLEQLIAGGGKQGIITTPGPNPQNAPGNAQGGLDNHGGGMIQVMADAIKNWITSHDVSIGGGNTAEAQKWADAQVGKGYSLGGNFGTTFDCSQFMSGITQIILGKKPSPLYTTFAFTGAKQGPATFERDLKAPFEVGVTNAGVGHMAGTLNGKNYEATPPRVRSGPGARGAHDHMFPLHYGMKASIGGGSGVIPSGQHLAIIDAALKAAGVPPPGTKAQWEAGMNTIITRESAWNSSAVNRTDSNAAKGTPSQGLAQVIAPTFAANHVAGTSNNILDPVANVAAAIRYIVRRYGNISNVQQADPNRPPKGYRLGTESARPGWHMIDEEGGEWINFRGGEKVLPHGRTPNAAGAAPVAVTVENHWHGNPTKEAVQYAEGGMADKLRQACIAGVGGRNH